MPGKEEQEWLHQAANNEFHYTNTERIISIGNYGAKSGRLLELLTKTVDDIEHLPTDKINQLSSVMDQMYKIIEDILK